MKYINDDTNQDEINHVTPSLPIDCQDIKLNTWNLILLTLASLVFQLALPTDLGTLELTSNHTIQDWIINRNKAIESLNIQSQKTE